MKQTNPTYLQRQYTKLTQKLQKAYQSGKFYQYTQYKQSQLLDKLASYTLQLKKLGMAAAVVTGVGMATPAAGQQYVFQGYGGIDNPIDTFKSLYNFFVDIDGDGDYDVVGEKSTGTYPNYSQPNYYYENIGNDTLPQFIERTPLLPSTYTQNPSFVDIDGDGDLDCFAGKYDGYNYTGLSITFYENTGSASSPVFTERLGNLNPMDTLNNGGLNYIKPLSFADIDGDGDMDCIQNLSNDNFVLYRNIGTSTNPSFSLDANNPFSAIQRGIRTPLFFADIDKDADLDLVVDGRFIGTTRPMGSVLYYENIGTAASPTYILRTGTADPFDYARGGYYMQIIDINGDGKLDMFGYSRGETLSGTVETTSFYLENITPTGIQSINQQKINLTISPNPTRGYLQLDRPISGAMEIFNTAGQVVQSAQLNEEQVIDLGDLTNGIYFLKVQTLEGLINEKIVLSK